MVCCIYNLTMKERFDVLDIFRGLFASLVFLYHLSAFSATPVLNNRFVQNADLFVDFFFVLSGFVIAYNYQFINSGADLKQFFIKRVKRLYPLHIILLVIFIVMELVKGFASHYVHVNKLTNDNNNIYTAFLHTLLLNSVKLPGIHGVSWNVPSWSISAEMIAYITFGLIITAINISKVNKIRVLIYGLAVITATAILYWLTGSFTLVYTYNYGFLRGIVGFFTGVICCQAYNAVKLKASKSPAFVFHFLEPLVIVITIMAICRGQKLLNYGYVFEMLFFVSVLIFAFERGWISALLKRPKVLHLAGKYSYSIYMTHNLILSLFNIAFIRVLKFPPSAYAYLFIPNYILIYYVSAWTYKNIEMRFSK